MKKPSVSHSGNTLLVNGRSNCLEYPVVDLFVEADKIIVLFDPDAYSAKSGQFRNLIAVSVDGEKIWEADLPSTSSGDRYYQISSRNPLTAIRLRNVLMRSFLNHRCI